MSTKRPIIIITPPPEEADAATPGRLTRMFRTFREWLRSLFQ